MSSIQPTSRALAGEIPAEDAASGAGDAQAALGFRGFPGIRPTSTSWIFETNEVWLASDAPRRQGAIVVQDRGGANDFIARLLSTHPEQKNLPIIADLVKALGGPEEAKKLGIREVRDGHNLFGLLPHAGGDRAHWELPVEVDRRLSARDYAGLDKEDFLVLPLPQKIADALQARGGMNSVASGVGISTSDGHAYLKVQKFNVVKPNGIF